MDIDIRTAWQKSDSELGRDARGFWNRTGMLSQAEQEKRSGELVAVAYENGKVLGVSTARHTEYKPLRSRFFYYRSAIVPDVPQLQVAAQICAHSCDCLAKWARQNPDEKVNGLYIELESDELLGEQRRLPVIEILGLNLILAGYTEEGNQIRIIWFDDARLEK